MLVMLVRKDGEDHFHLRLARLERTKKESLIAPPQATVIGTYTSNSTSRG